MKIKVQLAVSPLECFEYDADKGNMIIDPVFTNEKHPKTLFYVKVAGKQGERTYFATISPATGKVQLQELKKIEAGFDLPPGESPPAEEEESEDAK